MARKFKKKLARKIEKTNKQPVFSIELIRKETLEKVNNSWKRLVAKFKSLKLAK